ncbi:MAG: XkdX family protein [Peptococcaceae bacterium]|nr:XkdX family protein [Peptococcaceae bacterium]
MNKTIKEMAIEYFPKLWKEPRIKALVKAGKLTADDYKEITGQEYAE